MGGSSSRNQEVKQATEVDNSSGFHVIELHFPSTGGGLLFLFLIVLVAALIFCCCYFSRNNARGVNPTYLYPPPNPYPFFQPPPLQNPHLSLPWSHHRDQPSGSRIEELHSDSEMPHTPERHRWAKKPKVNEEEK